MVPTELELPTEQERLAAMTRLSDLMVERGLLALLVREVARLAKADRETLEEWRAFAIGNTSAGGFVTMPLPREKLEAAQNRAAESISQILLQGSEDKA